MTSTSSTTSSSGVPIAQPVVSVAGSNSAAAAGGSVINVSQLVSELVSATQAPQEALIANQTTAVTSELSAIGTLQSALSTFQSSLQPLSTPSAFNALSANSSNSNVFTASASDGAVAGSYSITVGNLASAQQLLSGAFAGGSNAVVGTGTLSLSLGGSSFSVTVNGSNDTVAGIAAAINAAANNPGISAAVVNGSDGAHVLLSSTLTGAANTLQVTETDAGNALAGLTYGTGNTGNYTEQSQALDASFSVAGVAYTSASNTVSNALSGVTLTLLGTTTPGTPPAPGTYATLTVANDTATVVSNIQAFVTAYNTLQSSLAGLGSYDPTSGSAGPLQGNPLLMNIQNQLRETMGGLAGSSAFSSLASIGITTSSEGSLSVNATTLQNALASNFSAVSQLFNGASGVATQLTTQLTTDLGGSGPIAATQKTLTAQENALTQQSNALNQQMQALTASLTEQYAALNTLLSSLQTTSAYLSQQFSTLPTVQGKPNA
jgi:flagellar hook-associated protein 2